MTKRKLLQAYNKVLELDRMLSGALALLSEAASEYTGMDLQADLCGGGEIEFRQIDGDGCVDDFSTLRQEDLFDEDPESKVRY